MSWMSAKSRTHVFWCIRYYDPNGSAVLTWFLFLHPCYIIPNLSTCTYFLFDVWTLHDTRSLPTLEIAFIEFTSCHTSLYVVLLSMDALDD